MIIQTYYLNHVKIFSKILEFFISLFVIMPNRNITKIELPEYFDLLDSSNQSQFCQLRAILASDNFRYNKSHSCNTIELILTMIKVFCLKDNEDDWKRCLVCGVIFFDKYVAINTRQLSTVLLKSKATLNAILFKAGYAPLQKSDEAYQSFQERMPYLRNHPMKFREWTVRTLRVSVPPGAHYIQVKQPNKIDQAVKTPQESIVNISEVEETFDFVGFDTFISDDEDFFGQEDFFDY
ncbi:hypothetical protein TRFO_15819 [Tritrichomonas foetus]|uniref:Initiator binding domain-containing protein n=1 Tax=Tritrichomonas foetus TaxID=1144522 RepID=A0A1J4KRN8_9EUKA|nr:hypothetical protein TRFO_15819 [Tritrichomonas foetus]|eukprot:OHT13923.1 hypothetical protein TRFO_15819 [Tritrichomonas foetus]